MKEYKHKINISDINIDNVIVCTELNEKFLVEELGHGIIYLIYDDNGVERELVFGSIQDFIEICRQVDEKTQAVSSLIFDIANDYVDRFILGVKMLGDVNTVVKYLIDQDTIDKLHQSKEDIPNQLDRVEFVYDKRKIASYNSNDIDPVDIQYDLLVRLLDLVFYHSILTSKPIIEGKDIYENEYYQLQINSLDRLRSIFIDEIEEDNKNNALASIFGLPIEKRNSENDERLYVISTSKECARYESKYTHVNMINPANIVSAASYLGSLSGQELKNVLDEIKESSNGKGIGYAHMDDCPTVVKGYKQAITEFIKLNLEYRGENLNKITWN